MIGAHILRKKTIVETFDELAKHQGNVLQIFVSNPRSGRITAKMYDKYLGEAPFVKSYIQQNGVQLWVHSAYTINLAKDFDPNAYWIQTVLHELAIASAIGARGVITHIGKNADARTGVRNMKQSVRYILRHCPKDVMFVLETSSHMGSDLLYDLDALCDFFKDFPRLRLCLDTAHVWAAGYDPIHALKHVVQRIGKARLALIQINNNPKPFGSRVDRHSCLYGNDGAINSSIIEHIVAESVRLGVPVVLETPRECWRTEIPRLRKQFQYRNR